jgi:ribosomal protein S18 acetylase RimI-like enzyme
MPEEYLDGLSADERAQMWTEALERLPRARSARFVAEDEMGKVVGFITVGPADGNPDSEEGEVYALNVDPDCWQRGCGKGLLTAGVAALAEAGFAVATLWVHPGNGRARDFYEDAGWVTDGAERMHEVLGVRVPEVRYRRSTRP